MQPAAAHSVSDYLQALGARTPAPASGSGAALAGAIGAALAELAGRFSDEREAVSRLVELRTRLAELADQDAAAYAAFMRTRSPEDRNGLYDRLVLELQRSLDHFDRQFRNIAVAKVMVTPVPGAEDMREHLAANLDVPVALIHLSELFDFPHIPELHEDARQAQCLQLIGAAMREETAAA